MKQTTEKQTTAKQILHLLVLADADVGRQPDNPRKKDVMDQLQEINRRTTAQRQSAQR